MDNYQNYYIFGIYGYEPDEEVQVALSQEEEN